MVGPLVVALVALGPLASVADAPGKAVAWSALTGFAGEDHLDALRVFRASCMAPPPARPALRQPPDYAATCSRAATVAATPDAARAFFQENFTPRQVGAEGGAFFTGYYEPVVEGSLVASTDYPTPLYGRPPDLVDLTPGTTTGLDPALSAARRLPDGRVAPMPDRAAINAGALGQQPLLYVREPVEAFFVQVQGSARIRLPDGSLRRLVYAGRNGYPYASIGKLLVDRLHIAPADMGMVQLKAWVRANGQRPGDAGTALMQENRSYIFFAFDDTLPAQAGPIGGEGISLTPLRSLAIDRKAWPYGLPFYLDAPPPPGQSDATALRRLMIGQDTGAAIVGASRGDLFFGTGEAAARRAGALRDHGTLFVLWPGAPAQDADKSRPRRKHGAWTRASTKDAGPENDERRSVEGIAPAPSQRRGHRAMAWRHRERGATSRQHLAGSPCGGCGAAAAGAEGRARGAGATSRAQAESRRGAPAACTP